MDYEVTILSARWAGSRGMDNLGKVKTIRFGNNILLHIYLPIFLQNNKFDLVVNDLGRAVP